MLVRHNIPEHAQFKKEGWQTLWETISDQGHAAQVQEVTQWTDAPTHIQLAS